MLTDRLKPVAAFGLACALAGFVLLGFTLYLSVSLYLSISYFAIFLSPALVIMLWTAIRLISRGLGFRSAANERGPIEYVVSKGVAEIESYHHGQD